MTTYKWHSGKEGKDSQALKNLRKVYICKICGKKKRMFEVWHMYCSTKCKNFANNEARKARMC